MEVLIVRTDRQIESLRLEVRLSQQSFPQAAYLGTTYAVLYKRHA